MRRDPILKKQRLNDHFLMQLAIEGGFNLTRIQQCRLLLQVNTVADISTAMGTKLEPWCRHSKGRLSKLRWPNQGHPSKRAWTEWNKLLDSLLTTFGAIASGTLKPTYKLGGWKFTQQEWPWLGTKYYAVRDTGEIYKREVHTLEQIKTPSLTTTSFLPIQVDRFEQRYQRVRVPPHITESARPTNATSIPQEYSRRLFGFFPMFLWLPD